MKNYKLGIGAVLLALLLSACTGTGGKTGWYDQWGACAAAGGGVGIAAGAFDEFETAAAAGVGGAIIGGTICAMSDTDADGVKNYKDDCRGTAAGGIVDGRGCELDSDGDGVVDSMDRCPNTPKGTPVDNYGCPLAAEYKLEHVNFEFDSAKLTDGSSAMLDEGVKILKRHSDLKVEIAGHTDSQGAEEYNQGLSERRAQAVADYLIAHGANGSNITVKGYGESQPVADNGTKEGRAANRRVELRH